MAAPQGRRHYRSHSRGDWTFVAMSRDHPSAQRILVVEDDAHTADTLLTLLRHYGYQVMRVSTVADAITQVNQEPDFLLLDLMLPDGEGEQVLKHIRSRGLRTKVVLSTAVHDRVRLRALASLKPDRIQLKPLNFLDLLQAMQPPAPPQPTVHRLAKPLF